VSCPNDRAISGRHLHHHPSAVSQITVEHDRRRHGWASGVQRCG
jgi:hypothetical protein